MHNGIKIPAFHLPSTNTEKFNFRTAAGRPVVVLRLFGSDTAAIEALVQAALKQSFLSLQHCVLFVILDHKDFLPEAVSNQQSVYWLFDEQNITAQVFESAPQKKNYWVLLDRMLRIIKMDSFNPDQGLAQARDLVNNYHSDRNASRVLGRAPVLIVDRLFEPEFCKELIAYYHQEGGKPSGVMRQVGEVTQGFLDDTFKKRKDCVLKDPQLIEAVKTRIGLRLRPLIRQAFHFDASRIERHLVGCYDHVEGGFFSPHIDNSTAATQHRKFAVTINLNAEEYEGGDLYFPEFGDDVYRAPTGGAVVFSGSLLHGVTRVTQGTRYAYLPFLFGEQEKAVRDSTKGLIVPHAYN